MHSILEAFAAHCLIFLSMSHLLAGAYPKLLFFDSYRTRRPIFELNCGLRSLVMQPAEFGLRNYSECTAPLDNPPVAKEREMRYSSAGVPDGRKQL